MKSNNLFVTSTDKNLGVAVVSRTWYIAKCKDYLANDSSITKISVDKCHEIMNNCQRHIDLIVMSRAYSLTEQEELFLQANPWNEDLRRLPRFSGLPKIYKKPTKFRPIIPCHSFIGETGASMLSHLLDAEVKNCNTILLNSRTLAQELTKIKIPFGKKAFMLSADVEAFYPNVPLNAIHDVVEKAVTKHHGEIKGKLARELCSIANNYLVFRYGSDLFVQTNGLAMGVACSPHIANLYTAAFEEHMSVDPNVLIYKRYIDDIFTIVITDSLEDALTYAKERLVFPGLKLIWEGDRNRLVFLDLEVMHVPTTGTFDFRPYRKPLNHFERIPFSSEYPKWMKTGAFLGEMSRLAAMSSSIDIYKQAIKELASIYLSREYTLVLVQEWIKLNYDIRCETRYRVEKSRGVDNLMVIKSVLNPIWEWDLVDVRNVQQGIQQVWEGSSIPPKLLEAELIISRKRTINFGDLCQRFNSNYLDTFPDVTTLGESLKTLHL